MNDMLEKIAQDGFGVMLWKNGTKGWLAALTEEREGEMVPGSTNWDYSPTPERAIEKLSVTALKTKLDRQAQAPTN